MALWGWAAFVAALIVLLWIDLRLLHRDAREISIRHAATWSVVWLALALAFGAAVWLVAGAERGGQYLTGYLVERVLSIDNLFVFALLFSYFAVPPRLQDRALIWGIVVAVVLRAGMIFAGIALLDAFHWTLYLFGALLVVTGVRMVTHEQREIHPDRNPLLRFVRRAAPMTDGYRDKRLFVTEGGRRLATPLAAVLVVVASADLVFAIDSIPAILAISTDPFIVFTSNAFALLGMRALYFVLAGAIDRFVHLNVGLAVVLVFIGLKMAGSDLVHVPIGISLAVIGLVIGAAILASLRATRPAEPASTTSSARANRLRRLGRVLSAHGLSGRASQRRRDRHGHRLRGRRSDSRAALRPPDR
jgi:tellurite resistance protein TerC